MKKIAIVVGILVALLAGGCRPAESHRIHRPAVASGVGAAVQRDAKTATPCGASIGCLNVAPSFWAGSGDRRTAVLWWTMAKNSDDVAADGKIGIKTYVIRAACPGNRPGCEAWVGTMLASSALYTEEQWQALAYD